MKKIYIIAFIVFFYSAASAQFTGNEGQFHESGKQNKSYPFKEDANLHKLKIGDIDLPINSYNSQIPGGHQLEILNSVLTDDFLVNDTTIAAYRGFPSIAMDEAENFVIAWEDEQNDGDIYFQLYDSNGIKVGTNTKVNDDNGSGSQFNLSVAMDRNGNFVIAWQDGRNLNHDIYIQRYNSTGSKLGINTKVNDDTESAYQVRPSIAIDESGNFIIIWADERNNLSGGSYDIYFQRYTSIGTAIGTNTKVNDYVGTASSSNSISIDQEGNFIIVWEDNRNDYGDIYFQRYDSSSIQQGTNTKVNDDVENARQSDTKIALDAGGNFVIVWVDGRDGNYDIYYQRYNFDALTLGSNMKSNDDTGTSGQFHPAIAIESGGNFIIAWTDYRNGTGVNNADVVGQRYYTDGNLNGYNYMVATSGHFDERDPDVIANNNKIIFCWSGNRRSDEWDIYGKIVGWDWNGVTSINEYENIILKEFLLSQNFPNPFNPSTKIKWHSPVSGWQTLKIYDVLGNEIATLADEYKLAGSYEVEYDASSGIRNLVSGVYFYQLKVGIYSVTKKMQLIK